MSVPSSDPQAFGWIKPALTHCMTQAMESLDGAVPGAGEPDLEKVADNLHQVQGSLQMIELSAASTLAQDMELLINRLVVHEQDSDPGEAAQVLRAGLNRLQSYLDSIEKQVPVSPLSLVDSINGVRRLSSREPISAYELFDPPLDLHPGFDTSHVPELTAGQRATLLAHLHKRYRGALLGWLNDADPERCLDEMAEVLNHLHQVSKPDVFRQLWWVAAGLVDLVRRGEVAPGAGIKAQFARLDAEMGRVQEGDSASIISSPPDELMRRMLYFIGHARAEADAPERVLRIRASLDLDLWFAEGGGTGGVEHGQEQPDLAGAIREFNDTLGAEFMPRLESLLDLHFSGSLDGEQARQFMQQVNVLEAAGRNRQPGELASFVGVLCTAMRTVSTDTMTLARTGADVKVASALLLLKTTLHDPGMVSGQWLQSIAHRESELTGLIDDAGADAVDVPGWATPDESQAGLEYVDARSAVADEMRVYFKRIEELMSEHDVGGEGFAEVAGRLHEIAVWFQVLEMERAHGLAEGMARLLSGFNAAGVTPRADDHERIAFVLASIEACAGQLEVFGAGNERAIERALAMLGEIRPEESVAADSAPPAEPDGAAQESAAEPVSEPELEPASEPASEPGGAGLDSVSELIDEIESLGAELAEDAPAEVAPPRDETGSALDDPELRGIFVDELARHSDTLFAGASALRGLYEDAGADPESMRPHQDEIIRTVHTLAGNFKNLDLRDVGTQFQRIEECLEAHREDAGYMQSVCPHVLALSSVLHGAMADIDSGVRPGSGMASRYARIADQFERPQADAHGRGAPIDDALEPGADGEHDEAGAQGEDFAISHLSDDAPARPAPAPSAPQPPPVPEASEQWGADPELRAIFLEESRINLGRINQELERWRQDGASAEVLSGLRREFHTLKGSAAATGYDDLSALSHSVESLLESDQDAPADGDSSLLNLMEEIHDGIAADLGFIPGRTAGHLNSLGAMVGLLLSGEAAGPAEATEAAEAAVADEDDETGAAADGGNGELALADDDPSDTVAARDETPDAPEAPAPAGGDAPGQPVQRVPPSQAGGGMRIGSQKIGELLNYSGELGLTRAQLESTLGGVRSELDSLRITMGHIRDGLRDLEFEADAQMRALPESSSAGVVDESFDPLQMDRYSRLQARARDVNRQLETLARVERQLNERASEADGALIQQAHLGEQLQSGLMGARMVAVNEYAPRLRRLVRETARVQGKAAAFRMSGGEIEVDRQVMETMMAPFEHMIRNSIVHGLEEHDARVGSGKNEEGLISISVVQQGAELLIGFSDDGGGLDVDRVREKALEMQTLREEEAMTNDLLLHAITRPGFTTSGELSMAAGRGVGMDVVSQAVRTLGGSMRLARSDGQGVEFQFRLPVTMAISQALLVRAGAYRFVILSRAIERVMRVRHEELENLRGDDGEWFVSVDDERVPVINLMHSLGETPMGTDERYRSFVTVRNDDRLTAVEVDQFDETIEVVARVAGAQLASITGVSGVTVLADSSLALILDPGRFAERTRLPLETPDAEPEQAEEWERPQQPQQPQSVVTQTGAAPRTLEKVLVVDDSLVVRKVMQRDLEGAGLTVFSAVDGVDALERLAEQDVEVDVALVDLEMPRMNGYELLEKLRADPVHRGLPVIVITSRSGDIHRNRAMELGADAYLTKPYDVDELKALMESALQNRAVAH